MHAAVRQSGGQSAVGPRGKFVPRLLLAAWLAAAIGEAALARSSGDVGPNCELIDQWGKPFTAAALVGRPYAIFFGFTHCPDVCPTTLMTITNALERLGADADRLSIVFVSVDPQRDTPKQLRQYLAAFDGRIIGLTGTEAQIAAAAKGWKAFYHKLPEDDATDTIVHSAYVYLMDCAHQLVGTMGFQDSEEEQVAKLKGLLQGSRP
jgi:protein SCO1/2